MTLDWKVGGLALGLVFFLAVLLVKPIGVSTQFVILDGILWDAVDPAWSPRRRTATPRPTPIWRSPAANTPRTRQPVNYSFVFVLPWLVGGCHLGVGARRSRRNGAPDPELWKANFGDSAVKRYAAAFMRRLHRALRRAARGRLHLRPHDVRHDADGAFRLHLRRRRLRRGPADRNDALQEEG
jgi:hypothetical protein